MIDERTALQWVAFLGLDALMSMTPTIDEIYAYNDICVNTFKILANARLYGLIIGLQVHGCLKSLGYAAEASK